jgi:ariadne-1
MRSFSSPSLITLPQTTNSQCLICYDNFHGDEMITFRSCGEHYYCVSCLTSHLNFLISDIQTVGNLHCPAPNCFAEPTESEVRNLVSESQYNKYLDFAARSILMKETRLRWCPLCGEAVICDDANSIKITCPSCHRLFCYDCKTAWHSGPCKSTLLEGEPESGEGRLFQKWLDEKGLKVKPCPNCGISIEKNSGCNHMTCNQCGYEWCWLCRGKFTYTHYDSGQCENLHFEEADSLEEAVEQARQTAVRYRRDLLPSLCRVFALYPFLGASVVVGVSTMGVITGQFIVPSLAYAIVVRWWGR